MNKRTWIILLFVCVTWSAFAQGLRTGVCTVYPEVDRADSVLMSTFARELARVGFTYDAQMLRGYTAQPFGSGVLTDQYVLTNRHVVGYAKTVRLVFELRDRTLTFEHCRVLSTGTTTDIAAIELPANLDGLHALPLSEQEVQDGEDIYAAGFPGLANEASWQLTRGSISNSQLRMGPETYIQHTAPIDPGSSGGPLLRKRDGQFEIVGLNTMKAFSRDRVGMAISVPQIRQFLSSPHHVADQHLLAAYDDVDAELWHEYYMMLPDSMKQMLHDMDMHLPMDRVEAVVAYYGGKEAIQKKTTQKTSGRQQYDKRLDRNRAGWTDLNHRFLFYASYNYFLGRSDRHMAILSSDFANRWGIIGISAGYTTARGAEDVRTQEIFVGVDAGLHFPFRVAPDHYLVPRATLSAMIGGNFSPSAPVMYIPFHVGLDYHYELSSVDLVLGAGYTLLTDNLIKHSSGISLSHGLQLRLGVSF